MTTIAPVDALYSTDHEGPAELVHGEIVPMSPTGGLPGFAATRILVSLDSYSRITKRGIALPDNVGFVVDLAHRQSFSPDVAFTDRPLSMKFIDGAPLFAVEVRSANDYGPKAEADMKAKRHDYFETGTKAVWDVDLQGPEVVRLYLPSAQHTPTIFRRGDTAHAEPALPNWKFDVNDLFVG